MLRRSLQLARLLPRRATTQAIVDSLQAAAVAESRAISCLHTRAHTPFMRQGLPSASLFDWRSFSTEGDGAKSAAEAAHQEPAAEAAASGASDAADAAAGAAAEAGASEAEPVDEKDAKIASQEEEIAALKDKLMRALADMENLRDRAARQAENAQKFAIQGFVKDILDVPDNLERAVASARQGVESADAADAERLRGLLLSLLEGVEMTDKVLMQALSKHGIERLEALGQQFDPNLHNALFEMPDPSREPGTVAQIVKTGYTLHGRVVRPAHVGVVRAP